MIHPAKQWHHETLAHRTVEALKRNDFDALYVPDPGEARQTVLSMIPAGATIGFGTSMTLEALGIFGPCGRATTDPSTRPGTPSPGTPRSGCPCGARL